MSLSGTEAEAVGEAERRVMASRIVEVSALLGHLIQEAGRQGLPCAVTLVSVYDSRAAKQGIGTLVLPAVVPELSAAEQRSQALAIYEQLKARFEHPLSPDYLGPVQDS